MYRSRSGRGGPGAGGDSARVRALRHAGRAVPLAVAEQPLDLGVDEHDLPRCRRSPSRPERAPAILETCPPPGPTRRSSCSRCRRSAESATSIDGRSHNTETRDGDALVDGRACGEGGSPDVETRWHVVKRDLVSSAIVEDDDVVWELASVRARGDRPRAAVARLQEAGSAEHGRSRHAGAGILITRVRQPRSYARWQQYRRLSRAGQSCPVERGTGRARSRCDGCRSGVVRRRAPAGRDRPRALHPPLALARPSQPNRRAFRGRGAARSPGGLEAEGWRLRHSLVWQGRGRRLGSDRAVRDRDRDRDQDADLRSPSRDAGAGAGRVATTPPATVVSRRGTCCVVSRELHGVKRVEDDVLVVSIDRLAHILRVAAGVGPGAPSRG